jgi:hypothetical protein
MVADSTGLFEIESTILPVILSLLAAVEIVPEAAGLVAAGAVLLPEGTGALCWAQTANEELNNKNITYTYFMTGIFGD